MSEDCFVRLPPLPSLLGALEGAGERAKISNRYRSILKLSNYFSRILPADNRVDLHFNYATVVTASTTHSLEETCTSTEP